MPHSLLLIWDPGADDHGEGARCSGLFSVWTPIYKLSLLNLIPSLNFLLCPTHPWAPPPLSYTCSKRAYCIKAPPNPQVGHPRDLCREVPCGWRTVVSPCPTAFTGGLILTTRKGRCIELASPCRWPVGSDAVGVWGILEGAVETGGESIISYKFSTRLVCVDNRDNK